MKITNIRVKNNYKIKLTNSKLAGVNAGTSVVAEQGTRTPIIPTPPAPPKTFQQKYDIVFKYLMDRYEPGWSAGTTAEKLANTLSLMGISSAINPLTLGGTAEAQFNQTSTSDLGWFDPLTYPRNFSTAVRAAYKRYERARKPKQAKHRFADYQTYGIGEYSYSRDGGNQFFNMALDFNWFPEEGNRNIEKMGLSLNHQNGIERILMHSPYGHFGSPMTQYGYVAEQSLPWITDRFAPDTGFRFDQYLLNQESATLRDLLNDVSVIRDPLLGITVDGITDSNLNTSYRGLCYAAGTYSVVRGNRSFGGFSANQVAVGSPWISYPNGLTWVGALTDFNAPGLCFNTRTLIMFDGSTFPSNPQTITDRAINFTPGISYGNGLQRIAALDALSAAWGNTMEFIAYLGFLPYGAEYEQTIPWMLFKDPTDAENVRYYKWRLDASVSHWKDKFKSPIDGFPHVFVDAGAAIERTYHQYQAPTYTTWANITPSGASFVENIPVSWARDQHNHTFGNSGTDGVVVGMELFAWYDFDGYPSQTLQKKSSTDTNPRFWGLDADIATTMYMRPYDLFFGQRFHGLTFVNSIWGMGVCGSSELGELFAIAKINDKGTPDGYPFFYNTFIRLNGNALEWKGIPGTAYNGNVEIPWYHDRRFRLFYLYPSLLAIDATVVDILHSGHGYFLADQSGWYDKRLGLLYKNDMEALNIGPVVSNDPYPNRRTPTTPPQNFWSGNARTSEFELLYACMKGGITGGLDSLFFTELFTELDAAGATGF